MTHTELVLRAIKWLRDSKRCVAVLSERMAEGEIPDAIGWRRDGFSYVVECKASYSDFLAESKKPHRRLPHRAMGNWRYYFAEPGVVPANELPDRWGLLEVHETLVKTVVAAEETMAGYSTFEQVRREMQLLVSEVGRYQFYGMTYPKLARPDQSAEPEAEKIKLRGCSV